MQLVVIPLRKELTKEHDAVVAKGQEMCDLKQGAQLSYN